MSDQGTPAGNQPDAPAPSVPDGHGPVEQAVGQAHANASGQLAKLTQAKRNIANIRGEMETLTKLGDSVTPEDVIKGAGMVVGKGGDPMQLAGLLADMPQGGEALQGWLQQHDQQMTQNEQQVDQLLAQARHSAGSAALHVLAMDHIRRKFEGAQGAPQAPTAIQTPGAPPNALAP